MAGRDGPTGPWGKVDGSHMEPPGWHWYPHRWAGGLFTADARQVNRLLPAPLRAVRWGRGRTVVCAFGAVHRAVGGLPPLVGYGEIGLLAWVTRGEKPAAPFLPMLGSQAMVRFGTGTYRLMSVVTSRAAAEQSRVITGTEALVGDVREEQRPGWERFVCEVSGQLVRDLRLRADGRPSAGESESGEWYVEQDGSVFTLPSAERGISRGRFGPGSARLVLGRHPLADAVRQLSLSRTSVGSEFLPDRHAWITGRPAFVGAAGRHEEMQPPGEDVTSGRLVVSYAPGIDVEVSQGALGDHPAGAVRGPALRERASGGRVAVVYESMLGATREVAEAIAAGLTAARPALDVDVGPVGLADAEHGADLLVVGAPTHDRGLPRRVTRTQIAREAHREGFERSLEPGSHGPGVREWLSRLEAQHGRAAAFDTRLDVWRGSRRRVGAPPASMPSPLSGGAAREIARRLRRAGYSLVASPQGFSVYEGVDRCPLREGERERAVAWGRSLAGQFAP